MLRREARDEMTGYWKTLAMLLLACSLWLVTFSPKNSLFDRLGVAVGAMSCVLLSWKNYLLVPTLLMLIGALLGAIYGYLGTFHVPILILAALAVITASYGWWKDRQAKLIAKRQTHRS